MLWTALSLGIVLGGGWGMASWLLQPGCFPIRVIEIRDPLKWTAPQAVTTVVSEYMKQGFFGLDVVKAQKDLSQLPWIESVTVRRVWPERILISAQERVPLARYGEKGVLNTDGHIFYPDVASVPSRLPRFNGPQDRVKEIMQQYFVLLELLSPVGLSVSDLNLSPEGSWNVVLDNGLAIILGKSALSERMGRFVWAYPNQFQAQTHKIAYLDLRYTNGMAVGWKTGVQ